MNDFLKALEVKGIKISKKGNDLSIKCYNNSKLDEDTINLIKTRKTDILKYFDSIPEKNISAIPFQDSYNLTSSQHRMWILSQFEGGSQAYNISFAAKISGQLEKEIIEQSFKYVVDRHEILRTSFRFDPVTETARQFIQSTDEINLNFEYLDFSHLVDKNEKIKEIISENNTVPFKLENAPLFKICLFKTNENESIFFIVMHHIISDGWSVKVLFSEIFYIYNCIKNNLPIQLPKLDIQYKDYSSWVQEGFRTEKYKNAEIFWLDQLKGEIPILDLSTKSKRPAIQTFNGDFITNNYLGELPRMLNEIAKNNNVSLFILLETVVKILLYRYSGQKDIIIGTPVAGREHPELENQIGLYINTIAIRSHFDDENSFVDLLSKEKTNLLNGLQNQQYPFSDLVSKLDLIRDPSHSALFDVMIVLQNHKKLNQNEINLNNFTIEPFEFDKTTAHFDLTFTFEESEDELTLKIEYNTDIYNELFVKKIFTHFENIVKIIYATPSILIEKIDYLSISEKEHLVSMFDNSNVSYPSDVTIIDIFEEQALKYPDNIAVVFGNDRLTYKELNEASNQLGAYLREQYQTAADDLICINMRPGIRMVISILGILKSGAGYVPINADFPSERVNYIIKDTASRVVLDENEFEKFALVEATYSKSNIQKINTPDNIAYVIYTSGTTGNPKGVIIEHRNVTRLLLNEEDLFDFSSVDVWTMFHSYSFDFSVWEMYGALFFGGKLIVIATEIAKDPKLFLDLLIEEKVTILNQTPSAFYNLIAREAENANLDLRLRYVIFGGEALAPKKLKDWKSRYPQTRLINMYGITETTVHVTYKEIMDSDIQFNISNIGKPLPTLSGYVLDQNQQFVPIGLIGELYVGGLGVGRGYLNQEELTRQKFIENPFAKGERLYRSGDLVRILANGEMQYEGRIDEQVKIRGYRIELGEIESAILSLPKVKEAALLVKEDASQQKSIFAYVTTQGSVTVADFRNALSSILPEYMIPSWFIELESMPLTVNGKIDKKALYNLGTHNTNTGTPYAAPTNEIEEKLVLIWQKVLEREAIGIHNTFFELGGDSIKVLRIINESRKSLNLEISVADIYRNNTIKSLADYIVLSQDDMLENMEQLKQRELQVSLELEGLKERIMSSEKITDPENIEDVYPMSDIETGMVFTSLFNEIPGVYHDQFVYTNMYAEFDIERFEKALALLTAKHEILRTGFNIKDFGAEVQIVYKKVDFRIYSEDIAWLDLSGQEQRIRDYLRKEVETPFDFSKAPLWKMSVFYAGADKVIFVWQFHHSILDGWSNASFITELNNLYLQLKDTPDFLPQKLKSSYRDFIFQNEIDKHDQTVKSFWIEELSEHTRLDIFSDEDFAEPQGFSFSLDKEQTAYINALAKQMDVTVKAISFSAFACLMKMLNYNAEVVVGMVTNTRPSTSESDKILGCFLNTIPLKIHVDQDLQCRDFIQEVNDKLIKIKKFEKLSLAGISKILSHKSDQGNPFFDMVFNYIDFYIYDDIKDESVHEQQGNQKEVSSNELTNTFFDFNLSANQDSYSIALHSRRKLKSGLSLEKISELYFNILDFMVKNPQQSVQDIHTISKSEKQLLDSFNVVEPYFDVDKGILELIEEQVKINPDKIAIQHYDHQINYKSLDTQTNHLAGYLINRFGVKEDFLFGVMMDRSVNMMVSILGIWKSSGAYVPLDKQNPDERLQQTIEDSGIKALLIDDSVSLDQIEKLNLSIPVIHLDQMKGIIQNSSTDAIAIKSNLESLAYVIYTSGSTGKPKGVMIEHWGMINHIGAKIVEMKMDQNSVVAQNASHTFDISVWQMFSALALGGTTIIYDYNFITDIVKFTKSIDSDQITVLELVPSYFNEMLHNLESLPSAYKYEALKILILNAETLLPSMVKRWFDLYSEIPIVNTYGATEVSDDMSHYIMHECPDYKTVPVMKRPIQYFDLYIVDRHLKQVPVGVMGEILLAGPGVGRGYLNNKELTEKSFLHGPIEGVTTKERIYRTGDLAKLLPDGTMEFLGRIDTQVKVKGHRVELGEIELAFNDFTPIKEGVIIDSKNANGEVTLVAFYTSDNEIDAQQIKDFLKEKVPVYMVPSYFVRLESFPLTPNGKINRIMLKNHEVKIDTNTNYVEAETDLEKELVELWKKTFGLEKISLEDNFFDLGGDSFKAIRLVSLSNNYSVPDLYRNPTIRELAKHIKANKKSNDLLTQMLDVKEKAEVTIIGIPNSAGDPLSFTRTVEFIEKDSTNINFYGLKLPRTDPGEGQDMLEMLYELSEDVVREIQEKVHTPIIIFGQCNGNVLAISIVEILQRINFNVEAICIGAIFPRTRKSLGFGRRNDSEVVNFLTSLGSTIPTDPLDQEFFIKNFRYDSDLAVAGFNHYLEATKKRNRFDKFRMPLHFITGSIDPITKGYKRKHKRWHLFAETVDMSIIKDHGHYLLRDAPEELAGILVNITNNNRKTVNIEYENENK
ncbi:non-ribosomal peptide synthetase [[Flexibacter] sp. ATCC 35103]|uniref:non-ribosomal peptide synthetase n=1 Tax=[Flexibacter] sp. ATCC 35103 TaxID=1937528 RepID=UPI0009C1DB90|nr:non-ribosomal peptide synthetase [[Flexibacter] sp. ATCC 35103]AQX14497.1 monobactam NRPS scaffold 4 [[Flexibacter] sp. ATCC 35103]OMQ07993.1 hypothetical protein BXU01_22750 [[Flexibacter] sp. ATCC 35103]